MLNQDQTACISSLKVSPLCETCKRNLDLAESANHFLWGDFAPRKVKKTRNWSHFQMWWLLKKWRWKMKKSQINVSNFTACDIEKVIDGNLDVESLTSLESLIWNEVDMDEQKFINIASIFANFYGNVGSEFINKWNRS